MYSPVGRECAVRHSGLGTIPDGYWYWYQSSSDARRRARVRASGQGCGRASRCRPAPKVTAVAGAADPLARWPNAIVGSGSEGRVRVRLVRLTKWGSFNLHLTKEYSSHKDVQTVLHGTAKAKSFAQPRVHFWPRSRSRCGHSRSRPSAKIEQARTHTHGGGWLDHDGTVSARRLMPCWGRRPMQLDLVAGLQVQLKNNGPGPSAAAPCSVPHWAVGSYAAISLLISMTIRNAATGRVGVGSLGPNPLQVSTCKNRGPGCISVGLRRLRFLRALPYDSWRVG